MTMNFQVKSYLTSVVGNLHISPDDHQVALAKYSDSVHAEFLFNTYTSTAEVAAHINNLEHVGDNTNTANVITWAKDYMASSRYATRIHVYSHSVKCCHVLI